MSFKMEAEISPNKLNAKFKLKSSNSKNKQNPKYKEGGGTVTGGKTEEMGPKCQDNKVIKSEAYPLIVLSNEIMNNIGTENF